ncbi:response regulator [Variovorax sp. RT4R15]|uniref:response regulator n=1 Tax=Variovorax sp. RT4R15 TaxID=3443737 RepID=UPI003F44D1D1
MLLKTILVEDNATIRANMIPAMGELAGLEVIAVAETQDEALDALQCHAGVWQLIVVDLFLREGTGIGVLQGCRQRLPQQAALVLTNYPTPEMRRRCREHGADGVFDKSTELEVFFETCLAMGRIGQ